MTNNFEFIDSRFGGYQTLVTGLALGSEWHLVNEGEGGIAVLAPKAAQSEY